jgi:hypothetical protein
MTKKEQDTADRLITAMVADVEATELSGALKHNDGAQLAYTAGQIRALLKALDVEVRYTSVTGGRNRALVVG